MTPSLLACTWLFLPFCILITLSTGDLEFYQDVPETSENMALKQLARYLESHHQRGLHRSHFPPLLMHPARKKHHLELDREKENILEALADKPSLNGMLRKQTLNPWSYHQRVPYLSNKDPPEKEYELSYYDLNPMPRVLKYPDYKLRYMNEESNQKQNPNLKNIDLVYPRIAPLSSLSFDARDIIRGMKEEPISEFHEKYSKINEGNSLQEMEQPSESMPKFSFHFDNANLEDKHPFAVKSNDVRYYQNIPFSFDNDGNDDDDDDDDDNSNSNRNNQNNNNKNEKSGEEKPFENGMKWEQGMISTEEKMPIKSEGDTQNVKNIKYYKLEDATTVAFSEPERRMGYHPLIVPVNHSLNNDIYFIAIVAGCSAAAMFALVLISLTWCRLQRGAKAAADIEYPAYGVTGPNKDVSPSSDQRLAQSAQMYHFQHQKQQIIAMENRTSATRDPGSVSEAESDEENEEGDYTVYECPGLASTGEMEVKNPLFHDDPTPATPAQTNKEEDHI